MSVIDVKNLKKYFGKTHAVDDVTFQVEKGEVFGFLGPNGAGKTTTIRCLMNFLHPSSGEIKIFGMNTKNDSIKILQNVGYLSGDVRLYDNWTGKDHILFFENIRKQKSIAPILAERLNFNPNMKFKNLSSGNKQKLGLILALCFEPELLIMDEPTLGLDPLLQNIIYSTLEDFQKRGSTVFISSHNLPEVDRICDRVGIIKDGKIVAIESITSLKDKRMHIVRVSFVGAFNPADFQTDGIEIQQHLPDGLILGIRGNINTLIQKLSKYDIRQLEISHASLEDIFLEFYGGVGRSKTEKLPDNSNNNQLINQTDLHNIPELKD